MTLTIQKPQGADRPHEDVDVDQPGPEEVDDVRRPWPGSVAAEDKVHVDVATVPGEHDTDNNKASFPVIFSLG